MEPQLCARGLFSIIMHLPHLIFPATLGVRLQFTNEKISPERFSNLLKVAQLLISGTTGFELRSVSSQGLCSRHPLLAVSSSVRLRGGSSGLTLVSVMLVEGKGTLPAAGAPREWQGHVTGGSGSWLLAETPPNLFDAPSRQSGSLLPSSGRQLLFPAR